MGAALVFAGLAIAPSSDAQTRASTTTTTQTDTEFVQSSKIIGSRIRSADGSEVGVIKDIVLDRDTGCMAYTVLETTGDAPRTASGATKSTTTTTTRKTVAMPYTAFQRTSEPGIYTTQIQRERIYSAPAYDYARMEEYHRPEYVSGIYSYYGVQPSVNLGIGISAGGTRDVRTQPVQSGVAASTNVTATPSPAATATVSPFATPAATATATASPTATATASPTATATASPKATATATASPAATATASPKAAATAGISPTATPVTTGASSTTTTATPKASSTTESTTTTSSAAKADDKSAKGNNSKSKANEKASSKSKAATEDDDSSSDATETDEP